MKEHYPKPGETIGLFSLMRLGLASDEAAAKAEAASEAKVAEMGGKRTKRRFPQGLPSAAVRERTDWMAEYEVNSKQW